MTNDMTQGKLFPILIRFTIPLVLGNLLQLTYNAVDSIIVGRYVGKEALAAVGTSNPLMTLIILFVQGICLGAGILVGTLFGAKDYKTLKREVSTGMISGVVFSAVLTVVSLAAAPVLLDILQVDEAIRHEAAGYLRIILCGLVFNFIYNFFASTLRAMGDSKSRNSSAFGSFLCTRTRKGNMQLKLPASGARVGEKMNLLYLIAQILAEEICRLKAIKRKFS